MAWHRRQREVEAVAKMAKGKRKADNDFRREERGSWWRLTPEGMGAGGTEGWGRPGSPAWVRRASGPANADRRAPPTLFDFQTNSNA
jgi:hypothetical protein